MKRNTKRRNAWVGVALVLPLLLGCCVFLVLPFGELVRRSVTLGTGAGTTFVGMHNYSGLLHNLAFRRAFGNTIWFLSLSLPLIFALAFVLALVLQRKRRKALLQTAILLPYVMPVVGTVTVLDWLLGQDAAASLSAVIALYLWKNTGYSVLILATGLSAIPKEHYESAQMDGATLWQQVRLITVPQISGSIFFAVVFSMVNAFKCFREIFLIGGKHPPELLYMLQHFLNNCFMNLNYTMLSCCAVVMLLALAVPFSLAYRWVSRREV